eukprot:SAG11_NODE_1699_length_4427_cov_3.213262_1_plen_769_part_00
MDVPVVSCLNLKLKCGFSESTPMNQHHHAPLTAAPLAMRKFLLLSFVCLFPRIARSQTCRVTTLDTLPDVVAPCCEATAEGSCAGGFPITCPLPCASAVVSFWDVCGSMARILPDDYYDGFLVSGVEAIVESCRQVHTLSMLGEAAGCAEDVGGLDERIQLISEECCSQGGRNVCVNGSPESCDSACALAFVPYFVQCIESAEGPSFVAEGDLSAYDDLSTQCEDFMPANETAMLLTMVGALDMDPLCTIDTGSILTQHEAKAGEPACLTDASGVCEILIASGSLTCKTDFCPLCAQPHTCDHTCGIPCGDSAEPAEACETDLSPLCRTLVDAGGVTCRKDFCANCEQAHTCDATCGFPCPQPNGGHRRLQLISRINRLGHSDVCDWDQVNDRMDAVDEACCTDGSCGENAFPDACSYDCGKLFVPFLHDCGELISSLVNHDNETVTNLQRFEERCLLLDPKTMVMAIHTSVCLTCGDGEVVEPEECDDGMGRNSDEPGARCRTNCMLAACGDGVVDPGEDCDEGPLNSDEPNARCRTDCRLAACGDGVVDEGEDCDGGPLNSDEAGAECSASCTRLCPALAPLDGATIGYSSGLVFPTTATYACDGSGGPPSDGDAVRECQRDGSWAGLSPSTCRLTFGPSIGTERVDIGDRGYAAKCSAWDGQSCLQPQLYIPGGDSSGHEGWWNVNYASQPMSSCNYFCNKALGLGAAVSCGGCADQGGAGRRIYEEGYSSGISMTLHLPNGDVHTKGSDPDSTSNMQVTCNWRG